MNRDTKGKFKREVGVNYEFNLPDINLLDRPPTVKLILLIFLFFWILTALLPVPDIKDKVKDYLCSYEQTCAKNFGCLLSNTTGFGATSTGIGANKRRDG